VVYQERRAQMKIAVTPENNLEIPFSLKENYQPLISFLEEQNLWQERPGKYCIFFDLSQEESFIFNSSNWQVESLNLDQFKPLVLSGLLIINSEQNQIKKAIEDLKPSLRYQAPVFVFEKTNNPKERRKAAKQILEEVGLVKRTVLIRPARKKENPVNQFLVWRARMPKEWKPKKPINLIDEGPWWRKKWIKNLIQKAAKEYRRAGFIPLNAFELGKRLRESTFLLFDIGRVNLGFGFELQAPCGCQWRVNLNGDWSRILDCGDPDCDGWPKI